MDECMAYEDEMRHRMKRAQDAAQNEGSEDNCACAPPPEDVPSAACCMFFEPFVIMPRFS